MKRYKRSGEIIYFAVSENSAVHFVPNVNWKTYLAVRKNVPLLSKIFATIKLAEYAAIDYEEFFRQFPDSRASMYNLEKLKAEELCREPLPGSVFAPKTQKGYFQVTQENEELRKEVDRLKVELVSASPC